VGSCLRLLSVLHRERSAVSKLADPEKVSPVMVPSYKTYRPVSPVASRTHAAIKRSDTSAEKLLLKTLQKLGVRYHRPKRPLSGNPDLVFYRRKVAVFCDGDFWHGRNWPQRRAKLMTGANAGYWVPEIEYNRRRDRQNSRLLSRKGWVVIRLWESIILGDPIGCAGTVLRALSRNPTAHRGQIGI